MKVLVVFAAVACFAHAAPSWAGHYPGAYSHGGYAAPAGGYHGPLAAPVVTPSGFLADTPEVAAAKAAHLSEVAKVSTHAAAAPAHGYAGAGYAGGYAGGYHGPLAAPVVTPSGFLADTPEVAAAKAAHLSLVAGAAHGGHYAGYAAPAYHAAPAYAAPAYAGAYAGAYDDGSYKGEGAYSSHYDEASHYDDGSYKPHVYEHGHY